MTTKLMAVYYTRLCCFISEWPLLVYHAKMQNISTVHAYAMQCYHISSSNSVFDNTFLYYPLLITLHMIVYIMYILSFMCYTINLFIDCFVRVWTRVGLFLYTLCWNIYYRYCGIKVSMYTYTSHAVILVQTHCSTTGESIGLQRTSKWYLRTRHRRDQDWSVP